VCSLQVCLGTLKITHPSSSELSVGEGDTVVLVCTADQGEDVEWRSSGFSVAHGSDPRFASANHADDGGKVSHRLIITNVKISDSGSYDCHDLEDPFGTDESVELKITKAASRKAALRVDPPSNRLTIPAGRKLHLKCIGTLTTTAQWYFNGRVMQESPGVLISSTADREGNKRTVLLTLHAAETSDAGQYQCKDSSGQMNQSKAITLQVDDA